MGNVRTELTELVKRAQALEGKVKRKIIAKDIVLGTDNNAIKNTNKFAMFKFDENIECWSNGVFLFKRGLDQDIDKIFNDNSKNIELKEISLNRLYDTSKNKVVSNIDSRAITTYLQSDDHSLYLNSHYYRYFLDKVEHFSISKELPLISFLDKSGEFIGGVLPIRMNDELISNFELELSLEEYYEVLNQVKNEKSNNKESFFNSIIEAKKEHVMKKMFNTYETFKDNIKGDIQVLKDIDGNFTVGYVVEGLGEFHDAEYIFNNSNSNYGYGQYMNEGYHFDETLQKLSKKDTKIISQQMHELLTSIGTNNIINEFKLEASQFDLDTEIFLKLRKQILNHFKDKESIELSCELHKQYPTSIGINLNILSSWIRIDKTDNIYKLKDMNNEKVLSQVTSENEVIEFLEVILSDEINKEEVKNASIKTLNHFMHDKALIIEVDGVMYLIEGGFRKEISRGKLKQHSMRLSNPNGEYLYRLHQEGKITYVKIYDGDLTKKGISELPEILITDILHSANELDNNNSTAEEPNISDFKSEGMKKSDTTEPINTKESDTSQLINHIASVTNELEWVILKIIVTKDNCIKALIRNMYNIEKTEGLYAGSDKGNESMEIATVLSQYYSVPVIQEEIA